MFLHLKKSSNLEKFYTRLLTVFLSDSLNPQVIICFGSYSRGEDLEHSDIDIAIIGSKEKGISLHKFEKILQRKISLHFISLSKVSEEFKSNLYNSIILERAL